MSATTEVYCLLDDGPAFGHVQEISVTLKELRVRLDDGMHLYRRYALWPHNQRIARFQYVGKLEEANG